MARSEAYRAQLGNTAGRAAGAAATRPCARSWAGERSRKEASVSGAEGVRGGGK